MVREVLKLKTFVDGTNDASFRNIEIHEYEYSTSRMGFPTITATVMDNKCLDKLWTGKEYVVFNGTKFYLKDIPTSSKANTDARYKHELTFRSEWEQINNVYFYDVVRDWALTKNKPCSNSTKFTFYGTIEEFVDRLNCAFLYAGIGDSILNTTTSLTTDSDSKQPKGDGFCAILDTYTDFDYTETKEVSFEDSTIWDAIDEAYNQFEVTFEFRGRTIIFGGISEVVDYTFKYGQKNSLLSITKTNANAKIINRITFKGSEDNIPYFYPNESEYGKVTLNVNSTTGKLTSSDFVVSNPTLLSTKIAVDEPLAYVQRMLGESNIQVYDSQLTYSCGDGNSVSLALGMRTTNYTEHNVVSYTVDVPFSITGNETLVEVSSIWGKFTTQSTGEVTAHNILTDNVIKPQSILCDGEIYRNSNQMDYNQTAGTINLRSLPIGEYTLRLEVSDPKSQSSFVTITISSITFKNKNVVTAQNVWEYNGNYFANLESFGILTNATLSDDDLGTTIKWYGEQLMIFQDNLMPPIYRETLGEQRFYNAVNNTYIDPVTGDYYEFPNPYVEGSPCEYVYEDEDIKPTIEGVENDEVSSIENHSTTNQLFGEIADIAFDKDDDDSLSVDASDDGSSDVANYKHSYFYIKLNIFNGKYAFNLFDCASQTDSMTLQMTSGNCNGCDFPILATQFTNSDGIYYYKNPVQVKSANGDIVEGGQSEKINDNNLQSFQQDTTQNSIWICVQKDVETFGVIMPNATNEYYPKIGDTFNIINISLPQSYILAAEDRGKQAAIEYMLENNEPKFTYSIDCSRVFFAQNPNILSQLNEYSKLKVEYDGVERELYVSSFSISVKANEPLPEIKVELSEDISIGDSFVQNVANKVESIISNAGVRGSVFSSGDGISASQIEKRFLRKDKNDTAAGVISFKSGFNTDSDVYFGENFADGITGHGGKITKEGRAWLQSLSIREYLEVPELRYNRTTVIAGTTWRSPSCGKIKSVTKTTDTSGIIELELEDGEVGSIAVDDICLGIYHFENGNSEINKDTGNGNFAFAGFTTVYFKVVEILTSDNSRFLYELRDGYSVHPTAFMTFAGYGNFSNTDRQKSVYSTLTYERYLAGVNDWEFGEDNIMLQLGDLSNLYIDGTSLSGYSAYLNNVYFTGVIQQLTKESKLKLSYSTYGDTYVADGDDCMIALSAMKGLEDVTKDCTWSVENDAGGSLSINKGDLGLLIGIAALNGKLKATLKITATYDSETSSVTIEVRDRSTLKGDAGDTGTSVTITSTTIEYASSSSGTTKPTSGWSTSIPNVSAGQYLWTRTTVKYSDGNSTVTYSVSRMGTNGTNGTNLTISSTAVTYAVTTDSTQPDDSKFTNADVPPLSLGDYLWSRTEVAYSDKTTLVSYAVSRIGNDGDNGKSIHIAYANSADGKTNFSTTYFTGALYIGTCLSDDEADPTDYTLYTWARLKGETGATGASGTDGSSYSPNLLLGTKDTAFTGGKDETYRTSEINSEGFIEQTFKSTTNNNYYYVGSRLIRGATDTFIEGKTYTLSFEYKSNVGVMTQIEQNSKKVNIFYPRNFDAVDEWTRVSTTQTITYNGNTPTDLALTFRFKSGATLDEDSYLSFRKVCVCEGTSAEWTPAASEMIATNNTTYEWQTNIPAIKCNSDGTLVGDESKIRVQCWEVTGNERTEIQTIYDSGVSPLGVKRVQYTVLASENTDTSGATWSDMPNTGYVTINGDDGQLDFPNLYLRVVSGISSLSTFKVLSTEHCIGYVLNGKQGTSVTGPDGAVIRMRGEYVATDTYYGGDTETDGIRYLDIVWVTNGSTRQYYSARKTGTLSKPTGATDSTWRLMSDLGALYTDLLVAPNASIDFLTGQEIVFGDSNGTYGRIGAPKNDSIMWLGDGTIENSTYLVDKNGKTRFGSTDASHIYIDPGNRQISVYDEQQRNVIKIDGIAHKLDSSYGVSDLLPRTHSNIVFDSTTNYLFSTNSVASAIIDSGSTNNKISLTIGVNNIAKTKVYTSGTGVESLTLYNQSSCIATLQLVQLTDADGNDKNIVIKSSTTGKISGTDYTLSMSTGTYTNTVANTLTITAENLDAGSYVFMLAVVITNAGSGDNLVGAAVALTSYSASFKAGESPKSFLGQNGMIVSNSTQDYVRAGLDDNSKFLFEAISDSIGLRINSNGIYAKDESGVWKKLKLTFES